MENMNTQKNEVNGMTDLKSEIVETARHLNSLINPYEEGKQKNNFRDTLLTIKENKNPRSESRPSLKDYMETLKDFYGEITIKTLRDNYDDSLEIKFYTDKIDDAVINTLERYKDYEVYDVRCEQYCSLPPIDCRIIILDNRKRKTT